MTRTQIINNFVEKKGYQYYLEIGVHNGIHFNQVKCQFKVGVDPDPTSKATILLPSDDFFKANIAKFDIIFIDGLHSATQVYKDIINSLACLNDGGVILCHDMLPPSKLAQDVPRVQGEWTGDCWMAFVWLRATRSDLAMYTIDTDYGIGVIKKGYQELLMVDENITYENFVKNKKQWMNVFNVSSHIIATAIDAALPA